MLVVVVSIAALVLVALKANVASLVISLGSARRDSWSIDDTIHSELLGRDMPVEAFVPPPTACGSKALLVLFPGRGGTAQDWMQGEFGGGVGVDAIAHDLIESGKMAPVVIVSASIDESYGVDSAAANDGYSHGPYESYIATELVPQLQARHGMGATNTFVGGLSMGGYAALNAAFDHPDLFSGVGALSPAFFVNPPADREWIYQGVGRRSLYDAVTAGAADGKHIFLGYGDTDYAWIKQATARLADSLAGAGIEAPPVIVPGGHETATWRQLAAPMLEALFPPEAC